MKIYTSDEILGMDDLYQLQELVSSGTPFRYKMTKGESGWYEFIKGKYSIADFIRENSSVNYTILFDDMEEMSNTLDDDCKDFGKAVMLSDESALQKIFFWLYQESE